MLWRPATRSGWCSDPRNDVSASLDRALTCSRAHGVAVPADIRERRLRQLRDDSRE
jgi:hypothetical protein